MPMPANPDTSPDGIGYGHVFAKFTEGAEDGSVDLDPYPNERHLTGTVTFRPSFDGRATNAALRVPGSPRSRGMVIVEVPYTVTASQLVDNQGREGAWLIIQVGDIPIYWQASVTLRDNSGRTVMQQTYTLGVDSWVTEPTGAKTANLPDLIPTPKAITPPEGAAVMSAQASMSRALEVAAALEAARPAIEAADDYAAQAAGFAQAAGEKADRAQSEADRAIGLANAQDSAVAAHVATSGRQTQSAVDSRITVWQNSTGNATYEKILAAQSKYAPRTGSDQYAPRTGSDQYAPISLAADAAAAVQTANSARSEAQQAAAQAVAAASTASSGQPWNRPALESSADLNALTVPGFYPVQTHPIATSLLNGPPVAERGGITVYNNTATSGPTVFQEWTQTPAATADALIWQRWRDNAGVWSPWRQLFAAPRTPAEPGQLLQWSDTGTLSWTWADRYPFAYSTTY